MLSSVPKLEAKKATVLIVEDEAHLGAFLKQALHEAEFDVLLASNIKSGRTTWLSTTPDLVVLDLMLGEDDGLELLAEMRAAELSTPVLVLSAKSTMEDRVDGLNAGADDYLPKPFGIEELLARLRAMLRRKRDSNFGVIQLNDLKIDPIARRVTRCGRVVFLSETEYRILEALATNEGTAVSKREILRRVWDDEERDDNVLEVYISYLRNKLELGGARRLIHTVRGKGYVLIDRKEAA